MGAPTPTARVTPSGKRLRTGHNTLITFASNPDIQMWELAVTPFGVDGGDPIDISTMYNEEFRQFQARVLKTITEGSFRFAYDPEVNDQDEILALINKNDDVVTLKWWDGSTYALHAYARVIQFDEVSEGQMPTGTCTIQPTCTDTSMAEQKPVLTNVSGT